MLEAPSKELGHFHAVQSASSQDGGHWLQVLPHLDPAYGGLCAVVPRLARELKLREHLDTRVAAFCSPDESRFADTQEVPGLSIWPLSRSAWLFDSALKQRFQSELRGSSGVHIHGLWESSTMMAASTARKQGLPYVLSAHGMLERWALRNKRLKKTVYAALSERRNVSGAACLHALTHEEAEDYRRFGCRGPIAIIPNGVEADASATATPFLKAFPQAEGKKLLLFLGRIHYKKGVDLLVNAWATIADRYPDALLVLAGPDSEGTLGKVLETVKQLNLGHRVLLTGMLDGPMKWSALAAATCFVLPSYSEGLSVAALEAMSLGVPLILSNECNLPEVREHKAGWLITTDTRSLSSSLESALSSNPAQLKATGQNARNLAQSSFSWESVARRMSSVYRWIEGGPEPTDVELLRSTA